MRTRDTNFFRRAVTLAATLIFCTALEGCGAVKIAYDHGETFAMFWLGRYVDLDAQQTQLAHERIGGFIEWHRRTQLPDYVILAKSMQAQAASGITLAEQAEIEGQLRERAYRALNRGLPDLADMALSLHVEQLTKTREKFADNDREFKETFVDVSPEKRNRDRADKWRDRLEYWYGDLDENERKTLDALSNAQPVDNSIMLAERQARERDAIDVLTKIAQDKPPRGEVIQALASLARRLETSSDPKRRAYLETIKASNNAIYVKMSSIATPEQRQKAVKRLGEWIDDMNAAAAG
jgi:hypothetical protein